MRSARPPMVAEQARRLARQHAQRVADRERFLSEIYGAIFMPRQEEIRYAYEHAMEVHNLRDPLFGVTTHTEVVDSDDPYQTSKKPAFTTKARIHNETGFPTRPPECVSGHRLGTLAALSDHVDSRKDGGHG
ncbi:hypothetical protein HPB51_006945 [Rhipicephalus microplus]|uniref:Uncharacterized protein n=1 Tax=Rhipicephalus microplus TaxID=6941 RepID=A0A9J6DTP6_RHIMP|nr:hypothetical protein HPB51_006945 [Rhipicephalus microplus]